MYVQTVSVRRTPFDAETRSPFFVFRLRNDDVGEDHEERNQNGERHERQRAEMLLDGLERHADDEAEDPVEDRRRGQGCGAVFLREQLSGDDCRQRTEADDEQYLCDDDARAARVGRRTTERKVESCCQQDVDQHCTDAGDEKKRSTTDAMEEADVDDRRREADGGGSENGVGGGVRGQTGVGEDASRVEDDDDRSAQLTDNLVNYTSNNMVHNH